MHAATQKLSFHLFSDDDVSFIHPKILDIFTVRLIKDLKTSRIGLKQINALLT